jgi:GTPase SAR1 family protein
VVLITTGLSRVMPEQSNDYNVVVFGAGQVGKSALVLRFVRGAFRDCYVPTIEDTYSQVISCNKQVSGRLAVSLLCTAFRYG